MPCKSMAHHHYPFHRPGLNAPRCIGPCLSSSTGSPAWGPRNRFPPRSSPYPSDCSRSCSRHRAGLSLNASLLTTTHFAPGSTKLRKPMRSTTKTDRPHPTVRVTAILAIPLGPSDLPTPRNNAAIQQLKTGTNTLPLCLIKTRSQSHNLSSTSISPSYSTVSSDESGRTSRAHPHHPPWYLFGCERLESWQPGRPMKIPPVFQFLDATYHRYFIQSWGVMGSMMFLYKPSSKFVCSWSRIISDDGRGTWDGFWRWNWNPFFH